MKNQLDDVQRQITITATSVSFIFVRYRSCNKRGAAICHDWLESVWLRSGAALPDCLQCYTVSQLAWLASYIHKQQMCMRRMCVCSLVLTRQNLAHQNWGRNALNGSINLTGLCIICQTITLKMLQKELTLKTGLRGHLHQRQLEEVKPCRQEPPAVTQNVPLFEY